MKATMHSIPAEAVDAAIRIMYDQEHCNTVDSPAERDQGWRELSDSVKDLYRADLAVILAAVLPAHKHEVRAEVGEELRRAATGRRYYAAIAPDPVAEILLAEAATLESAAKVAEGDLGVLLGLIPVAMWTADEDRAVRGEAP